MKKLHYKIYRCYEIVILDEEENEVGDCNYCYGTKADAIDMAKHELEIAEMEIVQRCRMLENESH